jgi:hypothetical protein
MKWADHNAIPSIANELRGQTEQGRRLSLIRLHLAELCGTFALPSELC